MSEKNSELKKLLPNLSYIEFSNDLSNFDIILNKSLSIFKSSKKQRKDYARMIKKKHSWHVRSKEVLKLIKFYIK